MVLVPLKVPTPLDSLKTHVAQTAVERLAEQAMESCLVMFLDGAQEMRMEGGLLRRVCDKLGVWKGFEILAGIEALNYVSPAVPPQSMIVSRLAIRGPV